VSIAKQCDVLVTWTRIAAKRILEGMVDKPFSAVRGYALAREDFATEVTRSPTCWRQVVCVSRISYGKGSNVLLSAAENARLENQGYTLKLAGGTEFADAALLKHLEFQCSKSRVLHCGQLDRDGVRQAFRSSMCSVLPSLTETLGRVIIESVMQLCPCLVSSVGDHISFLQHMNIVSQESARISSDGAFTGTPCGVIVVDDASCQNDTQRAKVWGRALLLLGAESEKMKSNVPSFFNACSTACEGAIAKLKSQPVSSSLTHIYKMAWALPPRNRCENKEK